MLRFLCYTLFSCLFIFESFAQDIRPMINSGTSLDNIVYSHNGNHMIIYSQNDLRVFDLSSGLMIRRIDRKFKGVDINREDNLVVGFQEDAARIYEFPEFNEIEKYEFDSWESMWTHKPSFGANDEYVWLFSGDRSIAHSIDRTSRQVNKKSHYNVTGNCDVFVNQISSDKKLVASIRSCSSINDQDPGLYLFMSENIDANNTYDKKYHLKIQDPIPDMNIAIDILDLEYSDNGRFLAIEKKEFPEEDVSKPTTEILVVDVERGVVKAEIDYAKYARSGEYELGGQFFYKNELKGVDFSFKPGTNELFLAADSLLVYNLDEVGGRVQDATDVVTVRDFSFYTVGFSGSGDYMFCSGINKGSKKGENRVLDARNYYTMTNLVSSIGSGVKDKVDSTGILFDVREGKTKNSFLFSYANGLASPVKKKSTKGLIMVLPNGDKVTSKSDRYSTSIYQADRQIIKFGSKARIMKAIPLDNDRILIKKKQSIDPKYSTEIISLKEGTSKILLDELPSKIKVTRDIVQLKLRNKLKFFQLTDQGIDEYFSEALKVRDWKLLDGGVLLFLEIAENEAGKKRRYLVKRDLSANKEINRLDLGNDLDATPDALLSKEGDFVITVTRERLINVFNARTLAKVGEIDPGTKVYSNALKESNFFTNRKGEVLMLLVSKFNEGSIYRLNDAQLLGRFHQTDNTGNFVYMQPDGYYMSSPGAVKTMSFDLGEKTAAYDQFDLVLNRPDMVLNNLGVAEPVLIDLYKKAWEKRIKKHGVDIKVLEDLDIPVIKVSKIPFITDDKSVTVQLEASSANRPLKQYNVLVNDVPVFGTKGIRIAGQVKNHKHSLELELSTGPNKISFSVIDSYGVESVKTIKTTNYTQPVPKPNLYVVAIGVSEYVEAEFDLNYAAKDAQDIIQAFKNENTYASVTVLDFMNEKATRENILKAKSTLMQSGIEDKVVLFVAGHGLLDDELDYYLAMHDMDFSNPASRGLKYEELEGLLDGIPARKKLILIDACHSGEVDKEETESLTASVSNTSVSARGFKTYGTKRISPELPGVFETMNRLFADLRKGTGATVISSASGVEFAFESPEWSNGVFTYALIEGIRDHKGDLNKDGEIHVSELKNYIFNRVMELTDGKQHPTSRHQNLENDFVISQ